VSESNICSIRKARGVGLGKGESGFLFEGAPTEMSKRYEEPIDVEAPDGAVEAFWWRGKRYAVRQVLCRWRESGGWWEGGGDTSQPWLAGDDREIWRVDAQPATNGLPPGTYELSRDLRSGKWTLFRVWD
jgi:hypothetical protein